MTLQCVPPALQVSTDGHDFNTAFSSIAGYTLGETYWAVVTPSGSHGGNPVGTPYYLFLGVNMFTSTSTSRTTLGIGLATVGAFPTFLAGQVTIQNYNTGTCWLTPGGTPAPGDPNPNSNTCSPLSLTQSGFYLGGYPSGTWTLIHSP